MVRAKSLEMLSFQELKRRVLNDDSYLWVRFIVFDLCRSCGQNLACKYWRIDCMIYNVQDSTAASSSEYS